MNLAQARDKTSKELGARVTKLLIIAFLGEVRRENATIQVQLMDLFVDVLKNECMGHNVIKEAPIRLGRDEE